MKKLIFIFVLFPLLSFSQQPDYKLEFFQKKSSLSDVISRQETYFNTLKANGQWDVHKQEAYSQFERWVLLWKDRVNTHGRLSSQAADWHRLVQATNQKVSKNYSTNIWSLVGPPTNVNPNSYTAYPGMGRINVVAVDPSNNNIMYAGAASGGVWKTTDAGSSWQPMSDVLAGLGVTDLIINPANPNIIYLATGDRDGYNIPSIGLYKSTDGGQTWNATGLTFNLSDYEFIRDIAFVPGNSNKIFALTNTEIKYSTNGGNTWTNANVSYPYVSFTEWFQSLIFDPNNANHMIATDYWGSVYTSTDGGVNFAMHAYFIPGTSQNILRLTTSVNDLNNFYGLYSNGSFVKIRYNMNNTAADLISTTTISGFSSYQGYCMTLAVSPTNKNYIMLGGIRGYLSTDNGQNFSVLLNPYNNPPGVGFYVHPDHHFMQFLNDGITLIDGHDGGIHKGPVTPGTWVDLSNGLVITQSYNIAVSQATNDDDFMMANQDNDGFSKVLKNGTKQWVAVAAGDGTVAGIDYMNPQLRYLGGTNGALYSANDGYASSAFSGVTLLAASTNAAFVSGFAMHPIFSSNIYVGYGDVLKSNNNGNAFTALNSGLTKVSFIDVSGYQGQTQIYVIGSNGQAKRSFDDGISWINVNNHSGALSFTSFCSKQDTDIVYATLAGYNAGQKVIKSTDGGLTWALISAGIPNIAVKKVVLKADSNDETLFLATELGVYWKNNTMTMWQKLGLGLPNVLVKDLRINYADQELYVGTYGRSMWKISIVAPSSIPFSEAEKPSIYPNPVVQNIVHIKIPETLFQHQAVTYKIYNIVGGIIGEGELEGIDNRVELRRKAKGLYLINIRAGNKSFTQKLLVQ